MQTETGIDRKKMWREFERQERQKNKKKLVELRLAIRSAQLTRKAAIQRARQVCREIRDSLRALIKAMRERALEWLRKATQEQKDKARSRRDAAMEAAKSLDIVSRRKAEFEAEARHQSTMRLIESNHVKRRRAHPRATYLERRSESDDEVRSNIPSDLWPLFERVKRGIAGGPRMSRSEQFMKYAEEHPDEIHALLQETVDDKVEAMVREKYGEPPPRKRERAPQTRGTPKYTPRELAEVPF